MNETCRLFDRACREIIGNKCPESVKGLSKLFRNKVIIEKIIIRYKAIEKAKIKNKKINTKKKTI